MVTPINDQDTYDRIKGINTGNKALDYFTQITIFIDYLLKEDVFYINSADHPAYEGQKKVIKSLEKKQSMIKNQINFD